jgi:hypothetical protein
MWGCLSLYWGSTVDSNLNKLSVYAIDLDGGAFGQQMLQGINASIKVPARSLGWHFDSTITSDAMSKHLVLNEQAWAVVQSKPRKQSTTTSSPLTFGSKYQRHVQPAACSAYRQRILQLTLGDDYLHPIGAKPDNNQFQGHTRHPRRRKPASREAWRRIYGHIPFFSCRKCERGGDGSSL